MATALVVAVAVPLWLTLSSPTYSGDLDPQNPDPEGAQAVARVLDDEGVEVDIVRSDADLADADLDDAALVVTSTALLGERTTTSLLRRGDDADMLIAVDPSLPLTHELDLEQAPTQAPTAQVDAGCDGYAGLRVEVDLATPIPTAGCFETGNGPLLALPDDRTAVLGAGELLRNDQIEEADNAAVALRLLGGHERLVWYVPSSQDLDGADGATIGTLLPRWLGHAVWLLAVVVVALMLWRGRRLGSLVPEPLPVVVKAIESTRARGRLYRRGGDRAHAARTLRAASRHRWAARLGLPPGAADDLDRLVPAVQQQTGIPIDRLRALLDPWAPGPGDDRALADLARDLATLDRTTGTLPDQSSHPAHQPVHQPASHPPVPPPAQRKDLT